MDTREVDFVFQVLSPENYAVTLDDDEDFHDAMSFDIDNPVTASDVEDLINTENSYPSLSDADVGAIAKAAGLGNPFYTTPILPPVPETKPESQKTGGKAWEIMKSVLGSKAASPPPDADSDLTQPGTHNPPPPPPPPPPPSGFTSSEPASQPSAAGISVDRLKNVKLKSTPKEPIDAPKSKIASSNPTKIDLTSVMSVKLKSTKRTTPSTDPTPTPDATAPEATVLKAPKEVKKTLVESVFDDLQVPVGIRSALTAELGAKRSPKRPSLLDNQTTADSLRLYLPFMILAGAEDFEALALTEEKVMALTDKLNQDCIIQPVGVEYDYESGNVKQKNNTDSELLMKWISQLLLICQQRELILQQWKEFSVLRFGTDYRKLTCIDSKLVINKICAESFAKDAKFVSECVDSPSTIPSSDGIKIIVGEVIPQDVVVPKMYNVEPSDYPARQAIMAAIKDQNPSAKLVHTIATKQIENAFATALQEYRDVLTSLEETGVTLYYDDSDEHHKAAGEFFRKVFSNVSKAKNEESADIVMGPNQHATKKTIILLNQSALQKHKSLQPDKEVILPEFFDVIIYCGCLDIYNTIFSQWGLKRRKANFPVPMRKEDKCGRPQLVEWLSKFSDPASEPVLTYGTSQNGPLSMAFIVKSPNDQGHTLGKVYIDTIDKDKHTHVKIYGVFDDQRKLWDFVLNNAFVRIKRAGYKVLATAFKNMDPTQFDSWKEEMWKYKSGDVTVLVEK